MINESKEIEERGGLPEQTSSKKPYEKPQIIHDAPLEAMAVVCDPFAGGKGPECVIGGGWQWS